jgi:hypothetical protein
VGNRVHAFKLLLVVDTPWSPLSSDKQSRKGYRVFELLDLSHESVSIRIS